MNAIKKFLLNISNFFIEVKTRWNAETPIFWKKILKVCIKLGIIATSLISADQVFNLQSSYNISPTLFTISGYIIVACTVLGLGAKLTKTENNDTAN